MRAYYLGWGFGFAAAFGFVVAREAYYKLAQLNLRPAPVDYTAKSQPRHTR